MPFEHFYDEAIRPLDFAINAPSTCSTVNKEKRNYLSTFTCYATSVNPKVMEEIDQITGRPIIVDEFRPANTESHHFSQGIF